MFVRMPDQHIRNGENNRVRTCVSEERIGETSKQDTLAPYGARCACTLVQPDVRSWSSDAEIRGTTSWPNRLGPRSAIFGIKF
jgi:hypothetical protein